MKLEKDEFALREEVNKGKILWRDNIEKVDEKGRD